ncbi:double zinc ribbon domain-containing protein [Actinocatenispora rupis]|uniref:DZANK-type domain-containing protein n=1 Tax=Actinocatenispora rupis TaxID=519421 RepID=A0A8J3J495_9ACTN|nr:zinc ribbon domain-containing protein [Actinocatenispora rupis]GID11860.1 hypothetical protein Aru02nite_27490 [Actinocatenispora rupis]
MAGRAGRARRRLGWTLLLGLSAIAAVLLVVHLLWPARVDAIALVLLVLVALPGLGLVLDSAELPGGVKVQFRALERRVERTAATADAALGAATAGAPTPVPPVRPLLAATRGGPATTRRCPTCGTGTAAGDLFCRHCGAELAPRCPRCGSDLGPRPHGNYCPHCGVRLAGADHPDPLVGRPVEQAVPSEGHATTDGGDGAVPPVSAPPAHQGTAFHGPVPTLAWTSDTDGPYGIGPFWPRGTSPWESGPATPATPASSGDEPPEDAAPPPPTSRQATGNAGQAAEPDSHTRHTTGSDSTTARGVGSAPTAGPGVGSGSTTGRGAQRASGAGQGAGSAPMTGQAAGSDFATGRGAQRDSNAGQGAGSDSTAGRGARPEGAGTGQDGEIGADSSGEGGPDSVAVQGNDGVVEEEVRGQRPDVGMPQVPPTGRRPSPDHPGELPPPRPPVPGPRRETPSRTWWRRWRRPVSAAPAGWDDAPMPDVGEVAELADRYERQRARMRSGPRRTAAMNELFGRLMVATLRDPGFAAERALRSDRAGWRLAGCASAYAAPRPELLPVLLAGVLAEDLPFNQYWGLRALARALSLPDRPELPAGAYAELVGLRRRTARRDADRAHEVDAILDLLAGDDRAGS